MRSDLFQVGPGDGRGRAECANHTIFDTPHSRESCHICFCERGGTSALNILPYLKIGSQNVADIWKLPNSISPVLFGQPCQQKMGNSALKTGCASSCSFVLCFCTYLSVGCGRWLSDACNGQPVAKDVVKDSRHNGSTCTVRDRNSGLGRV